MRQKRHCSARTRRGTPCQCKAIETKRGAWRCRLHGGLSSGPKTPEGRDRIRAATRLRWERYRTAQGQGANGDAENLTKPNIAARPVESPEARHARLSALAKRLGMTLAELIGP